MRETFLRDLRATVALYPLTDEIAERAGTISGQIGATALHREFEILTVNTRHFEMIPDLVLRQL
jgi:predicted nucleic acid-binding protein